MLLDDYVTELRLADLNGDDADDIIVVYGGPDYLQIFWSVPGCGLSQPETLTEMGDVWDADILDVNADSLLDIFVEASPGRLFLNDGAGVFSERPVPDFKARFAASADLANDTNMDLLAFTSGCLIVHLGDGSGGFQIGRQIDLAVTASATCAGVSDFNEDGYMDVVGAQLRQIDDLPPG